MYYFHPSWILGIESAWLLDSCLHLLSTRAHHRFYCRVHVASSFVFSVVFYDFCLPLLLITSPSVCPSFWLPLLLITPHSDYPCFCLSLLLITHPSVYPSFWLPLLLITPPSVYPSFWLPLLLITPFGIVKLFLVLRGKIHFEGSAIYAWRIAWLESTL